MLLALTGCAVGVGGGPESLGAQGAGERLYVATQDDAVVTVFDVQSREVVQRIDLQSLGLGPSAKPHHVVVEPDGAHWYVSLIGENQILKFDRAGSIVARAEFEAPGMMALHPDEDALYVGRSMSAVNAPQRIGMVRRSDLDIEEIAVFFPRPHAIAVSGDGERVYTASLGVNQLGALGWEGDGMELIDVEGPPHSFVQFALSPDGRWMVSTTELSGRLLVFDLTDTARPRQVADVEVGSRPWHPVFTPDSRRVFLGNKGSNSVSVVDAEGWDVLATITDPSFDQPHGSAVSADGRWVFISSNGSDGGTGSVSVIDTESLEVVEVLELGRNVTGLGTRSRQ